MIGETLGHYRVGEQLGRGGMGEVYVADDLNLNRKVALKFLPEAFAGDPERMARFEREAKLLASLNHPNIAAIYGLEQAEGKRFLVLELVEGETLAQRLSKGALPADETLAICRQVADGLEAAHEKGVIHRDLKPANVMITEGDKVKILDFGLAKALSDETQSVDSSQSPTLTEAMTRPGVILGTAAYMSPEQAKGKVVDKRADIWAFGCILYECLTGKRAFVGEAVTETLASVLKGEPDWQALSATTPPGLRSLLRRCLNKEVRNRLQAIGDIRIEIETLMREPALLSPKPTQDDSLGVRFKWWPAALTLILGVFVGAAVFNWMRSATRTTPEAVRPLLHVSIDLPKEAPLALGSQIPLSGYNSPVVSLSPEGRYLAYVGKSGSGTALYLRDMATGEVRAIAGTEGAIYAFFSPDEKWLGFLTNDKVKKVFLDGSAPITLCEARIPVLAWWTDPDIIYFTQYEATQVARVSAEGGTPVTVLAADDIGLDTFSDVLPDGRWMLANQANGIGGAHADIFLVNAETRETKRVVRSGFSARYIAPGYLVFARAGSLMTVAFDAGRQEVLKEPVPIAAGAAMESLFLIVHASSARNGLLAYTPGGDLSIGNLVWVGRKGDTQHLQALPALYGAVDLAPDGKRLAVHVADIRDYVWIYDILRGEGRRLSSANPCGWPLWHPDGKEIAVSAFDTGSRGRKILLMDPNEGVGIEPREVGVPFHDFSYALSWLPNDKGLAVQKLGALRLRAEFISFDSRSVAAGFEGLYASFSPDGRWVSYGSSQSGQHQVYIRSYPDGKKTRQISIDGGCEPRWKNSGELFYRNGNRWMSTHVSTGMEPHWDPPRLVFETEFIDTPGISYDVSPDGQHLLVVKRAQPVTQSRIDLIVNWPQALKKR
jgi:eukaryotic-like serine/threonine-protein kinase